MPRTLALSWRTVAVVAICLLGVLSLLPNFLSRSTLDALPEWLPQQRVTLGLDLQGGSYLLLEVDLAPVYRERLESMVGDVRNGLRAARIGYRGLGVQGDTVALTLTDPAQREQALAEIEAEPVLRRRRGQVRDFEVVEDKGGGGRVVLRLTEAKRNELAQSAINQSLEVVRRRIDELGTREGLDPAAGAGPASWCKCRASGTPRTSSASWGGPPV